MNLADRYFVARSGPFRVARRLHGGVKHNGARQSMPSCCRALIVGGILSIRVRICLR